MNTKGFRVVVLLLCVSILGIPVEAAAGAAQPVRRLVATEGKGYLETVDGYRVLHLMGAPEEMGYQHGVLLREAIRQNVGFLLKEGVEDGVEVAGVKVPRSTVATMLVAAFTGKIPERFMREMQALAKGAELPEWQIVGSNLIPELMHCSGFALLRPATTEKKLLHGRILDYGVDIKLQDHAVLILQQPEGGIPFVNVSYAGFIGSVTGMNMEQVSIGEMGGDGVGQWNGIPMSFLVRMVLSDAKTLDAAIDIFKNNPRTCEYYYVVADAKADSAVAMKMLPASMEIVRPGEPHNLLPRPVRNTVLLSAGNRYENLSNRVAGGYGTFTQDSALRLMDSPVAMKSNLHNVLMIPEDGVLYVANAAQDGSPAWKQPYHRFDVRQLMKDRPQADVTPASKAHPTAP